MKNKQKSMINKQKLPIIKEKKTTKENHFINNSIDLT